jgi:hypothetical protein
MTPSQACQGGYERLNGSESGEALVIGRFIVMR